MPICVVQGCHYRRGQKSRKQLKFEKETGQMVTLHRFPKDPTRRILWAEALTGWVDRQTDNSFICSCHFTDDSWEQSSVNRRLKPDAVPTIFPPQNPESTLNPRKKRRLQIKEEPLEAPPYEPEEIPSTGDQIETNPGQEVNCWDFKISTIKPENQTVEPEVLLTELHRADPVIPYYNADPTDGYTEGTDPYHHPEAATLVPEAYPATHY